MPDVQDPNQLPKFVGKYKIIRMIARSNDIVYEAIDPNLGRHIALKELQLSPNLNGVAKRERIERFSREAKAAGALKHANIVTIYEVGQHMEHRFIAMEYLEGQTLRDTLNIQGPFSLKDGINIALQLCDALGYAHQQGVVHRDVKPDNIHLIPPGRTVKLTDFGIARMLSEPSITATGQVFGTPSYMSPEQLTSRAVDHRTDIFSASVVIYEMLVGKKPFRGDSVVGITYQIMNTEPAMPPTLPPGIVTILTKALAKDPDHRYQSMRSLTMDLRKELLAADQPGYHSQQNTGVSTSESAGPTIALSHASGLPSDILSGATIASSTTGVSSGVATMSAPTTSTNIATQSEPQTQQGQSILATFDGNRGFRNALLTIGLCSVAIIAMIGILLWGAVQFYSRAHDNLARNNALKSYNVAIASAGAGDLPNAILSYQAAVDAAPKNDLIAERSKRGISDCLVAEGVHLQQAGDLDSAQETYNKAILDDPENPVAHFDLAAVFQAHGDQVSAMKEYTVAHTLDPLSPAGMLARQKALAGYYALGVQAYSQGNTSVAREDWQTVIDLDPGSSLADQARQRMSQIQQ